MKFQGYMEKEPVLRLMVFSASIFFILLVFPLHYDSFFKSTYNSYSVLVTLVDKIPRTSDTEIQIHNSSTTTDATSFTSTNGTSINTSKSENSFQKSNISEVVGKDTNNATKIQILSSSTSTIVPPVNTPNKAGLNTSRGENDFEDGKHHNIVLKVDESHIHSSSTSIITPPSTANKTRHNVLEREKISENRRDGLVNGEDSMKLQLRRLVRGQEGLAELESTGISCDSADPRLDLCAISQPIILEKKKNSLNIYATSSKNPPSKRVVRPYPKKEDSNTMNMVTPVNILKGNIDNIKPPSCQVKHNVPALVFSFGGFTDNNFHKFSEVLIPLFVTSRHFGSRVQLVVTDDRLGETRKFSKILKHLSPYEVIDANAEDDKRVHCFPSAVVGLRYFDNLEVNSTDTPGGYSMTDFKAFLRESYDLKVASILKPKRPKVLLISRQSSRSFLNEDKLVRLMKKLGFRVQKVKPNQMSNLDKLSKIVNSCDMMVGVHGAGLTNEVFLPDGAVVVQIVPLALEWASEHYFGIPSQRMGLKYLEYKIEAKESSLYDLYGPNDPIVSDPWSISARGFGVVKDLYIDRQHVRVDLTRFKSTLVEASKLLG